MYAEIIRSVIFPFSIEKYGSKMSLHQDNDPKHSSKLCVRTMDAYKISWVSIIQTKLCYGFIVLVCKTKVRAPPKSPDLNPIEWVWSDMKQFIRKKFCQNVQDLKDAVQEFNSKMTPEYCRKYIKKLKEVPFFL